MFSLRDILELWDRWPSWKKMKGAVERIEALEKRISNLEDRLARCPGEACPHCGEFSYRTESSYPHLSMAAMGVNVHVMKCEKCGFTDEKIVCPKK